MTELHRADPALRRLAAWLLPLLTAAGVVALLALQHWLARGAPGGLAATTGLRVAFLGIALLSVMLCLGIAALLRRLALRVRAASRYPPADMRTLRDVPVREGAAARRIAGRLDALAGVALLLVLGLSVWAAQVLRAA